MNYDNKLIVAKLQRWEKYLRGFALPEWDELPAFELYMDQVIVLLTRYLDYLLYDASTDTVITASTINNYVRMKIMPPPVKKRYSRLHLAYLIIICIMKQSLNIAYVQKMIPIGIAEEEVKRIYNEFVDKYKHTCSRFIEQISNESAAVLRKDEASAEDVSNLVVELAVSANLFKLVTEKIINLQGKTLADFMPEQERVPGNRPQSSLPTESDEKDLTEQATVKEG